jgi:hypothetical protein
MKLIIHRLDEALKRETKAEEKRWMWEKKGEYQFMVEEFNSATKAFENIKPHPMYKVCKHFAQIKSNDSKLLSPQNLSYLFEQNKNQVGKNLYYSCFYFHIKRAGIIKPNDYVPAVKNVLDLLNNVSHRNYKIPKLIIGQKGNHLILKDAPYDTFILPIQTPEIYNVLDCLNLNSINLSYSKLNDLEKLMGVRISRVQAIDIPLDIYKFDVINRYLGIKNLIIDKTNFNKNDLNFLEENVRVQDYRDL